MKKYCILFIVLALCVMNGACLTSAVDYTIKDTLPSFTEKIRQFYITSNQRQLIVLGDKHHFIFPLDSTLSEILTWSGRKNLQAQNLSFVISRGGKIKGHYSISVKDVATLTPSDLSFLQAHQFTCNTITHNDPTRRWCQNDSKLINGTVYDAAHFKAPSTLGFNQTYQVNISYDYGSAGQAIAKFIATPLAVAGDVVGFGTLGLGYLVLIPISSLFGLQQPPLDLH